MANALWTGKDLAALGLRFEPIEAARSFVAGGVSIDSRTMSAGDLFVAVRGEERDGHDFVAAALRAGAAGALVDHKPPGGAVGTLLYAEETLKGLETMGRGARDRAKSATRIAVTGSVGKTSTKEALAYVLAGFGPTHKSVASYNNLWGVPLTLARMPAATRYGVFEVGMNHAGEIEPLTRQVAPAITIVTTVEPVHLEHFSGIEAIADAKGEIFEGLVPGGTAILNRDNAMFGRLEAHTKRVQNVRIVTFGAGTACDARLTEFEALEEGSKIGALVHGKFVEFSLAASGRHNALNAMAVLAAAYTAGIDPVDAARRLEGLTPPSGRGARETLGIDAGTFVLVDESYNANPASMLAALSNLATSKPGAGGRRIAVLGDMLELGPQAPAFHGGLADSAAAGADLVFLCGPQMKSLHEALPPSVRGGWTPTSDALAGLVAEAIRAGDIVMVKGSLGSKMKLIVERLRGLGTGARRNT